MSILIALGALLAMLLSPWGWSPTNPPTCAELRQLRRTYTLAQMEQAARRFGVPESTIADYRRRCHLG